MSGMIVSAWPFNCVDCGERFQEGARSTSAGRGGRLCENCAKYQATPLCPDCFTQHRGECL